MISPMYILCNCYHPFFAATHCCWLLRGEQLRYYLRHSMINRASENALLPQLVVIGVSPAPFTHLCLYRSYYHSIAKHCDMLPYRKKGVRVILFHQPIGVAGGPDETVNNRFSAKKPSPPQLAVIMLNWLLPADKHPVFGKHFCMMFRVSYQALWPCNRWACGPMQQCCAFLPVRNRTDYRPLPLPTL